MSDIEKLLNELIEALQSENAADESTIKINESSIAQANSEILDCRARVEQRKSQMLTFQELFNAIKDKAENDCEALAMLYISDKQHADFVEFSEQTGIGMPEESEAEKEDREAGEIAAA